MSTKLKNEVLNEEQIQRILANAYLNLSIDEQKLFNPLAQTPPSFGDRIDLYIVWLMSRPEYFSFICEHLLNIRLAPFQSLILQQLWNHKFPLVMCSRGAGKTFLLGIYCLLRMLLLPSRKVIVVGSVFRQSKLVFEVMERIYDNAPLLRSAIGVSKRNVITHGNDRWSFDVGSSYTYAIPVGYTGEKVRGYRAHDLMVDEFSSVPQEVFETVLAGFGAVSSSPIENIQKEAAKEYLKEIGIEYEQAFEDDFYEPNQMIISGTASYEFNHFTTYLRRWEQIIKSKGDKNKLEEIDALGSMDDNLNWKDFCIIRIPLELLPKGFMEEAQIARSRATMHSGTYLMEYGACPSKDSQGFFKRSLIERCTSSPSNEIQLPSGNIKFQPILKGHPNKFYVMGIDTAAKVDLFAITILEVHDDHQRIVYLWTTDKKAYKEELKAGLTDENTYYAYCARKIRNLMQYFHIVNIGIDTQGGGEEVMETINDSDKMQHGESFLWPVIDEDKPKDTDDYTGSHIIYPIVFADANWTREANNSMRNDFEHQRLIFPYYDVGSVGLAEVEDKIKGREYDTLEECFVEIEELKDELCTIIVEQTPSGRERWDTPEVKQPDGKKGRLRKDRYTALLIANWVGRQWQNAPEPFNYYAGGGFITGDKGHKNQGMYYGPDWFNQKMEGVYDVYGV